MKDANDEALITNLATGLVHAAARTQGVTHDRIIAALFQLIGTSSTTEMKAEPKQRRTRRPRTPKGNGPLLDPPAASPE